MITLQELKQQHMDTAQAITERINRLERELQYTRGDAAFLLKKRIRCLQEELLELGDQIREIDRTMWR